MTCYLNKKKINEIFYTYYVLEILINESFTQLTVLSESQLKETDPVYFIKQFKLWTDPSEIFTVDVKLNLKSFFYGCTFFDFLPSLRKLAIFSYFSLF